MLINIEPFRALGFRTIKELAEEGGYTEKAIKNWIQREYMAAVRLDGVWYSLPAEVKRCAESRRKGRWGKKNVEQPA